MGRNKCSALNSNLGALLLIFCMIVALPSSGETHAFRSIVPGSSCKEDAIASLPDVRIERAQQLAAPVSHCAISGVIGTETRFELLLPGDWNGKFVMGGGGGFVGSVINVALAYNALADGYATVGTDTGHEGHPLDGSWALHNLERVVSFGHQAVHRTVVIAKALTEDYYAQPISRSLFVGCSRGGGQGLMSAQRYPDDFDGILAGAPAFDWTGEIGARNITLSQHMFPDPADLSVAVVTPGMQRVLGEAVLAQCDSLDGLSDGIINDPRSCDFDPASLACAVNEQESCLDADALAAVKAVYSDTYVGDTRVSPGLPLGAELGYGGWTRWLAGGLEATPTGDFQPGVEAAAGQEPPSVPNAQFGFGTQFMKYLVFHDPDWDYSDYDFDGYLADSSAAAQSLNADNPDLDAFRARGGKLLLTNSWRDMALSPYGTIEYYESVIARDPDAERDVKLFILPGVDHCMGGPGPSYFNYIRTIDDWVESSRAPEQLTAYWIGEDGKPSGSRPVCEYHQHLVYKGSGDPRDASSFQCKEP